MWYRRVYFQRLVSDVLVERGDVGVVMEVVVGGCANRRLYHYRMLCWHYRRDCWFVGVQLQLDVSAKMGGGPSRWAGWGVGYLGEEGVRPIGTSTFRSMLHESSLVGSRTDQCGLMVYLRKGDEDFQP